MGPVGSQMDYLGCQDTEWEGGNDKDGLEAIILWVHASMDIGKCGYLGCISGWFGALRGAPRVTDS